jgi:hypothetical protein
MYCPLCKTEYRDGFDRCSDCLIGLVPSREEAEAAIVVRVWQGTSQTKFANIVGALQDAKVPNFARSAATAEQEPSIWDYIPGIGRYKRLHKAMSWQVFVLQSDYPRASAIVPGQV